MRILYLEYIQQIGALPANAIKASRVTTCTNRPYVRLQILSTLHAAESCFSWGDHVSILRFLRFFQKTWYAAGRTLSDPQHEAPVPPHAMSKRSRFITFVQAATKSRANFSPASALA